MLKITELAGMLDCFHPSIAEEEKVVTVRDLDDLHAAGVQPVRGIVFGAAIRINPYMPRGYIILAAKNDSDDERCFGDDVNRSLKNTMDSLLAAYEGGET